MLGSLDAGNPPIGKERTQRAGLLTTNAEIPRISYPVLTRPLGEERSYDVYIGLQSLNLGLVRQHKTEDVVCIFLTRQLDPCSFSALPLMYK